MFNKYEICNIFMCNCLSLVDGNSTNTESVTHRGDLDWLRQGYGRGCGGGDICSSGAALLTRRLLHGCGEELRLRLLKQQLRRIHAQLHKNTHTKIKLQPNIINQIYKRDDMRKIIISNQIISPQNVV